MQEVFSRALENPGEWLNCGIQMNFSLFQNCMFDAAELKGWKSMYIRYTGLKRWLLQ